MFFIPFSTYQFTHISVNLTYFTIIGLFQNIRGGIKMLQGRTHFSISKNDIDENSREHTI